MRKAALLLLLFAILGSRRGGAVEGRWILTGAPSTIRAGHSATLLPTGKVLMVGGGFGNAEPSPIAEIYDPATATWSPTGLLESPRTLHTATLLPSGKVLVVGGFNGVLGGSLASAEVYDPATGTWSTTGSLGMSRFSHTATLLPSGKVLVVGGYTDNGQNRDSVATAEMYDPMTGTWLEADRLLNARAEHTATLLQSGHVLVTGGVEEGDVLANCELFDFRTGQWTPTGSLNQRRYQHSATLLPAGQVLVVGGRTSSSLTNRVDLYDPSTGEWSIIDPLSARRYSHSAVLLPSGKVLVAGGSDGISPLDPNCELYDPAAGTWTRDADVFIPDGFLSFPTATLLPNGTVLLVGGTGITNAQVYEPLYQNSSVEIQSPGYRRDKHTLTLLPNGRVLAVGGWSGSQVMASAEIYDPGSNTWNPTGSLMQARQNHTATLLASGKVLVAGGDAGEPFGYPLLLSSAEIYDPATGQWKDTGSMLEPQSGHTATLLSSGRVLIAGYGAEIYDPPTGTWTATGSMIRRRTGHTATLLLSGKVLVAGGDGGNAEIYDPSTNSWAATGSLLTPRSNHTATLLPSGRVLVVGGYGYAYLPEVEMYDPALGIWFPLSALALPRAEHEAVLLLSGKVLVVGGWGGQGLWTTAEVFDPASGWATMGPLNYGGVGPGAVLLPSGRVLLTVGAAGGKTAVLALGDGSQDRRPTIISATPIIRFGNPIEIVGQKFRGDSETSSGGAGNSVSNYPLIQMIALEGQQRVWLPPDPRQSFWDDPMTLTVSRLPSTISPGWYLLSVVTAGNAGEGKIVSVACSIAISRQPEDRTVQVGGTVTFAVETQGAQTFQWQKDGVDIPGATGSTYTTPPITGVDSGTRYRVRVGSACTSTTSESATLTVEDREPPQALVVSPSGGEYWLLSEPGGSPNSQVVTWSMSDNIRICRVEVRLLFSSDGGQTYQPVPDPVGGVLLTTGPGGTCRFGEQPSITSLSYDVPESPPSGTQGSLYKIEVRVTDHAGLTTSARSTNPFFIVQPNPDTVRTLILSNVQRMRTIQGFSQEQADALMTKLRELAGHPRVQGLVIDLASVTSLSPVYQSWDAEPANPDRANAVLFAPGGLHEYLRSELLPTYTGVRNLILVGDDRIIPFARVPDQTGLRESAYIAGGDLTAVGTVGAALAADRYLSDDLLATRGPVAIPLTADQRERGAFLPDFAVGRLVERPEDIVAAIATFISQDGVLDLQALHPSTGHKVLVTGYDFLIDSGRRIRRRWKDALGLPLPYDDGDLEPVDGRLLTPDWGEATTADRRGVLRQHLAGNGGARYGIANLNGHANHHQEGVPGTDATDIQGLGSTEIFGPNVCGGGSALALSGAVIYSSGCHGGLPVAGSCSTDADHSLDLPQTFLARGAQAYVANTGYGWGLKEGVGYGERLVEIFTEELTAGGTVGVGDAVVRAKQRYFLELPRFDDYDEKTLLQWTLFGLPMYAIRTGIAASPGVSSVSAQVLESRRATPVSGQVGPVGVKSRIEAAVSLPPHLTQLNAHFDFSALGVYTKYNALGDPLPEGTAGCPEPSPGEPAGCYYTLNSLAGGGTGSSDLPIQPYFLYDSRLSGTSQHGALWMGGTYVEESGWEPVTAELASNGGDFSNNGSTPWLIKTRPRPIRSPTGDDDLTCRPSDLEPSTLVVTTGESLKAGDSDPNYSRQRIYRGIDLEVLYFNDQGQGGNCDRSGPELGPSIFSGAYHQLSGGKIDWAVPASDEAGVWRVVVVYDLGPDSNGQGAWRPVELTNDGSGTWRGSLGTGGVSRLTYFLQAVDRGGNVSWLDFDTVDLPASGVPHDLPLPVEVIVPLETADLSLQLTDSPDPVAAGSLLTYTLSVANAGPNEAVSLTVTDTLPTGTTFLGSGGPWTCDHNGGTVTCTLPSLPAISSTTLRLFVFAPAVGGPAFNEAVVSALVDDLDLSNNSRTEQTLVNGPPASSGLNFYTVSPCRVADTRQSSGPLPSGTTRTFPVVGLCGIPQGAKAVSLNVTAVGGTSGGYMTLFPADQSLPSTSTINFQAGQNRANNAVLGLSSSGHLAALAALAGGGSVHLILDVNGYFAEDQP